MKVHKKAENHVHGLVPLFFSHFGCDHDPRRRPQRTHKSIDGFKFKLLTSHQHHRASCEIVCARAQGRRNHRTLKGLRLFGETIDCRRGGFAAKLKAPLIERVNCRFRINHMLGRSRSAIKQRVASNCARAHRIVIDSFLAQLK